MISWANNASAQYNINRVIADLNRLGFHISSTDDNIKEYEKQLESIIEKRNRFQPESFEISTAETAKILLAIIGKGTFDYDHCIFFHLHPIYSYMI